MAVRPPPPRRSDEVTRARYHDEARLTRSRFPRRGALARLGPMRLEDTLGEIRRAAAMARWRVSTMVRVGNKLGVHRSVSLAGLRVLGRELSRGKANMSTLFRYYT